MNWCVYMLECKGRRIYTGIAKDVEKRLEEHMSGKGARFTKAFPPKKLLKVLPSDSHGNALRLEYAIKQLSTKQKRQLIAGRLDASALPQSITILTPAAS